MSRPALLAACLLGFWLQTEAQHTKPVAHDEQLLDSKFRTRELTEIEHIVFGTDASKWNPQTECPHLIWQHWAEEVDSSVYATPAVFDVASDGIKDVVVPTFVRHIEILDGPNGHRMAGFPFTLPNSAIYASPLIYDINLDGEPDIGIATFNGELVWLSDNGMPIFGKTLKLPFLKLKKDWWHGLKPDPQDMEHTGLTQFERERQEKESKDPMTQYPSYNYHEEDSWDNDYYEGEGVSASDFMKKADLDGDKKIDLNEFMMYMHSADPALSPDGAEELFKNMDDNKNGKISMRELVYHNWELSNNESENQFRQADSDGDDKVNREEFGKHVKEDAPDFPEKDIDQMFKEADSDQDGKLTMNEAKSHWSKFDSKASQVDWDAGKVSTKKRARKQAGGFVRDDVREKAKGSLMAAAQGKFDGLSPPGVVGELDGVLAGAGLSAVSEKIRQMGVSTLADLAKLDSKKVSEQGFDAVTMGKIKRLMEKYNFWTEGNKKPSRLLLQAEDTEGGEPVATGSKADDNPEEGQIEDVPLDAGEGPDGPESFVEGWNEDEDVQEPHAPRDGEELVDGEEYPEPTGDGEDIDAEDDEYWYDRYHDSKNDDEIATDLARERYEKRLENFKEEPLNGPKDSYWNNLKGFFAPEEEESIEGARPGSFNMRAAVVGHDPIFTKLMAVDPKVLLSNLKVNKSEPLPGERPQEQGYVFVDPHVLCTPIIADLNRDGNDEIIFAVSYYFDKEQYSDPAAYEDLDVDVKISKYVAGAVVAFDVVTKKLLWQTHLDLTTDETVYRAYIYSSPTVADLDVDGKLEVILGTSLGFIYVLNHNGKVRDGFPVTMAEIQGQVAVADVNNDGQLELIAADSRHNVAVFSWRGKEVWEKQTSGISTQGPIVGDINGDGQVDVVLATTNGHIWALNGKTGDTLSNFPVKAGGTIMSPPLILKMKGSGLGDKGEPIRTIIVPAHDGFLYFVNGKTGCTFKMDIGENSYSMVLADDLNGNGKMDLLVTTMNGNIMCYGTDIDYEPLAAWRSREQGNNNVELRDGRQGIYVLDQYRHHHDNTGATMILGFQIVDNRPIKGFGGKGGKYSVRISAGGSTKLFEKQYDTPGQYLEEIPCPARRQYSTIYVEMINEHGQHFEDAVAMSFNMHFYRPLKWILLVPFMAMSGVLIFVKDMQTTFLPF